MLGIHADDILFKKIERGNQTIVAACRRVLHYQVLVMSVLLCGAETALGWQHEDTGGFPHEVSATDT